MGTTDYPKMLEGESVADYLKRCVVGGLKPAKPRENTPDPGVFIHDKIQQKLDRDKLYGQGKLTYNAAFSEVQEENPELTLLYMEGMQPGPKFSGDYAGSTLTQRIEMKLKLNKEKGDGKMSYSQALKEAQEEDPEMAAAYLNQTLGVRERHIP